MKNLLLTIYGWLIWAKLNCIGKDDVLSAARKMFESVSSEDRNPYSQKRRTTALRIWIEECGDIATLLRELPEGDIAGMDVAIPAALARLEVITDVKAVWQIWRDTIGEVKAAAYKHWQDLIDIKIMSLPDDDLKAVEQLLRISPPESPQHDRLQRIIDGGSPLDVILATQAKNREEYQRRQLKQAA